VQNGDAKQLMEHVVDEVLAVGRAARVLLPWINDPQSEWQRQWSLQPKWLALSRRWRRI